MPGTRPGGQYSIAGPQKRARECCGGVPTPARPPKGNTSYQRNQSASINRLPVEVFSSVLDRSMRNSTTNHMRRLRELSSVSKHWWDVVLATPGLWTRVTDEMSSTEITWALQKSKNTGLSISYGGKSCFVEPGRQDSFLNAVLPHAYRWKSLQTWDCPEQLAECLERQSPLLEDIQIGSV